MKAHLIDTHLLVSRSSAKVRVKYQGHVSQKMGVSETLVFYKHILFTLGLMIVIVTGFIFLSLLTIVMMAVWKAASGLENIFSEVLVKESMDRCTSRCSTN